MNPDEQHDDRPPSPPMFSALRGAEDWGRDGRLGAIVRWTLVVLPVALIGYMIFFTGSDGAPDAFPQAAG